jgi:hypothetical protein
MAEPGLYEKYYVEKNGNPIEDCFILEPEDDPAARSALRAYAEATENDELAADLFDWLRGIDADTAD